METQTAQSSSSELNVTEKLLAEVYYAWSHPESAG